MFSETRFTKHCKRAVGGSGFDSLATWRCSAAATVPTGIILLHEGADADFLHVLVDGLVEIFTEQNGGEWGISLINPISTFILAAAVKRPTISELCPHPLRFPRFANSRRLSRCRGNRVGRTEKKMSIS